MNINLFLLANLLSECDIGSVLVSKEPNVSIPLQSGENVKAF